MLQCDGRAYTSSPELLQARNQPLANTDFEFELLKYRVRPVLSTSPRYIPIVGPESNLCGVTERKGHRLSGVLRSVTVEEIKGPLVPNGGTAYYKASKYK